MEKNRKNRQKKANASNFVVQGGILAVAGILVRLIGMVYRIPLINIIGKEGNGYYTSAFSVYSILLIISSYSLPVAVSKMVAVHIARGQYRNSARILKAALIYATGVGGIGSVVLWFGADAFANALKMPFCSFALKTLAPTVWIMAYLGVLRGYFQGLGTMVPTAMSQIFEQIINAIVSVLAAGVLFTQGLKSNLVHGNTEYSFAFGAAGGTIGTGAGALIALLFFLIMIMGYRPIMKRQSKRDKTGRLDSYGQLSYVLTITILPIVLSSTVYNISSVIDNYFFGQGMGKLGQTTPQIASMWGTFGQYHLLFNIPVAIANALSSSLIPSLSRAVSSRDRKQVLEKVRTAIRVSMLIAIPAAVGLTALAGPVNNLLFYGTDNTTLITITMTGSLAVVFFSLSTVTNAVLQGINRMNIPIRNAVISLVIHVAALQAMLLLLRWGIYSVVYANILFAFIMCVLNGLAIRRYLRYRQEVLKTFVLPSVAAVIMGVCAFGVHKGINALMLLTKSGNVLSNLIATLIAVLLAVVVYGILIIRFKCLDEMGATPGGRKMMRAAKKLHLMKND